MVLGTAFDLNVLSYLVLVIMKEQGVIVRRGRLCPSRRARRSLPSAVGRGGTCPRTSGVAEPALGGRVRQSQPLAVGRGRARPRMSGEAEPAISHQARWSLALGGRARRNQSSVVRTRSVVAFSSDQKCQHSMVISSISLGTPVLGPRHCPFCKCKEGK